MDEDIKSTEKFKIVDNVLMIDDNYQTQSWLLRVIFGLNIFNALLQLASRSFNFDDSMSLFWLIFGLFSATILIYWEATRSSSKNIELSKIDVLRIKSNLKGLVYSLKLKNGKTRSINLDYSKYAKELTELKAVISKHNIAIDE